MTTRSVSVSAAPERTRRSWKSAIQSDSVLRWLIPAPTILLLVVFTLIPLIRTLIMSLWRIKFGRYTDFVGLDNYTSLLGDRLFWGAMRTTTVFTVIAVLGELILGYCIALLLHGEISRWRSVSRTLFLIPMVLCPVVVGITWRALLNPQYGWLNHLLGAANFEWLSQPGRALYVLAGVEIWQWTPFMFLIILAGLQGLPSEIMEAARVDGASTIQLFTRIIWPLMLPIVTIAVLLRAIDCFKNFDLVFNLTQGGPGTSTETLAFYLYRLAFKNFDHGYAAAASIVLSIIVGTLVALFLRRAHFSVGGAR